MGIGQSCPLFGWDWWGYTDANFATRKGVQLSAIRAMVDQITSGRR